jgi:hypothetical protein
MKSKVLKVLVAISLSIATLILFTVPALAAKPAGNLAGAVKIPWNLSAAVMPVPPYGSLDIPGSDTASKLIVNQPNGNTEVTITGAMNGLHPNTTYTVYLSNGYTPYVDTGWNVAGAWNIAINYLGTDYAHITNLAQVGTSITGGTLVYTGYTKQIDSGSVIGNAISIVAHYTEGGSGILTLTGTIAPDGSMSGNWLDTWGGLNRTGTWASTSGLAVKTHTGDTGWPGLFTNTVPAFTFTTDTNGAGSWHVNLKGADLPGVAGTPYPLSVWINEAGATMLISDTFTVTKG